MNRRQQGERIGPSVALSVLMAAPTPPPRNGMSVTTAHLLEGLSEGPVRVFLVDTADRRGLRNVGRLDIGNVRGALASGLRFQCALRRVRPDVVYVPVAQNSLGFLRDSLFLMPAKWTRTPVVVHLHGCAFSRFYRCAPKLMRHVVRSALRDVSGAVVLGRAAEAEFDGLVPRERVRVVPNGIPQTREPQPALGRVGLHGGAGVVLFLGSLSRAKGFLDLMRAVALLGDLPDLRFVFAGEYRDAAVQTEAEAVLRDASVGPRVEVVGPITEEEAVQLLSTAGVLVAPSTQAEGQPLVILEAFRAGTPVIATPMGCIPDTVTDGEDGILVPPNRPDALASAIRSLATDEAAWLRMSASARRKYEDRYTLESWVNRMTTVFKEAASSARGRGA